MRLLITHSDIQTHKVRAGAIYFCADACMYGAIIRFDALSFLIFSLSVSLSLSLSRFFYSVLSFFRYLFARIYYSLLFSALDHQPLVPSFVVDVMYNTSFVFVKDEKLPNEEIPERVGQSERKNAAYIPAKKKKNLYPMAYRKRF